MTTPSSPAAQPRRAPSIRYEKAGRGAPGSGPANWCDSAAVSTVARAALKFASTAIIGCSPSTSGAPFGARPLKQASITISVESCFPDASVDSSSDCGMLRA